MALEGVAPSWVTPALIADISTFIGAVVVASITLSKSVKKSLSELKPNGGSSLRDAIDRIESKTEEIEFNLAAVEAQIKGRLELDQGGSFFTDEEGSCAWVDSTWSELTGIELSKALGDGWIDGIHAEDRYSVYERWKVACQINSLKFNMDYRTAKGILVRGESVRLTDRHGVPRGHLGVIAPIEKKL